MASTEDNNQVTHTPFREPLRTGTSFEFVGKTRKFVMVSVLAILAGIAIIFANKHVFGRGDYLNWAIDFRGGSEVIFRFVDAADASKPAKADAGKVREALSSAGYDGLEIAEFAFEDKAGKKVDGMLVRTKAFSALKPAQAETLRTEFVAAFTEQCKKAGPEAKCEVSVAKWVGDRLSLSASAPVEEAMAAQFFRDRGHELKSWDDEKRNRAALLEAGSTDYHVELDLYGVDRQMASVLDRAMSGTKAVVENSYLVSPKEGSRLRNDGIAALFYSLLLIFLYLAIRFDVRYCPGAILALFHDAFLVIAVFAATWTEFSLTTIAAILTVIGYSVNDTVIIFDRIRENAAKLKDKSLTRVVNISINETLSRTVLTSLTLFVVTLTMNIFATGAVRDFAFAMNIGVVVGTYSSVFVAAPIFLFLDRKFYPPKVASANVAAKSSDGDDDLEAELA